LGTGNFEKLKRTFTTTLIAHLALALVIALVAETVGLWFVYNKLVIAPERLSSAAFVYHLSILTAVVNITQVPYSALIISHERMNVYAYTSIFEVIMKLIVVYLLTIGNWDKLELYAILLCILHILLALFYRFYCIRNFSESNFNFVFDRQILRQVVGYSGWNLFANTSIALTTQGTTVLINMFFNPSVVAGRAIANQVNMATNQFVSNFRTAANPQIVKKYAAGDFEGSKSLLIYSTIFSFYIMWVLILPILLVAENLLQLWLGQIPEYSVQFLRLALLTSLAQVFDTSIYTALYAKGQIRENAMLSPTMGFLGFILMYFLFKWGCSPISLGWVLLFSHMIIAFIIKPFLVIKIVGYTVNDICHIFLPCLKVIMVSLPIPLLTFYYQDALFPIGFARFFIISLIGVVSVGLTVWKVGLNQELKEKIMEIVREKLKR
jgi:O-antigen/teichoic acid export membrane protein